MKKEYTEPVAELVVMKLEAPLCESGFAADSGFEDMFDIDDIPWIL